jgi:hypothetical protein
MNTPCPFFIVGCGRSGTSLLRSFLNSHSRIAIPTESLFIADYLCVANKFDIDYLLELIVREPELGEWGLEVSKDDFVDANNITDVIRRLHNIYARSQSKDLWGQKTPRFVRYLDLIGDAFEDARFIHMIRDPRAVVNSLMMSDVHRSSAYHGARRWEIDVSAGLEYEESNPERIIRVAYEDLVTSPEEVLEYITRFLGLAYEPEMLVRENGTDDYSAFYNNIHANLDKVLSDRYIDKWKNELKPTDITIVEDYLHELMPKASYQISATRRTGAGGLEQRSRISRLLGLGAQFYKYLRERPGYLSYLLYRKWKLGLLKEFLWSIHY